MFHPLDNSVANPSLERLLEQEKKFTCSTKRIICCYDWISLKKMEGHGNEEDWATKAKAWAATKSVMENYQMQQSTNRNENHNYGCLDHYQQPAGLPTEVMEPLHPPAPQSSNDHVPFPMTGQQRDTNHSLGTVSCLSLLLCYMWIYVWLRLYCR